MRNLLLSVSAGLACLTATALAATPPVETDYSYVPPEALPMLQDVPESALSETQKAGIAAAQEIYGALQARPEGNAAAAPWMNQLQRRGAAIADEALAAEREQVLAALGIDDNESRVYLFASFDMPEKLLQSYLQEAIWSGAIVVFRGIPRGKTLREFITQDMYRLIGKKGASATIQIDPRLFDDFQVNAVPTIVYTEVPVRELCTDPVLATHLHEGRSYQYLECQPLPESAYIKLSGSVTLQWALELFVEEGFVGAQRHLDALVSAGLSGEKEQVDFEGDWQDIPLPESYSEYLSALQAGGQRTLYDTPFGLAAGPAGLQSEDQKVEVHTPGDEE